MKRVLAGVISLCLLLCLSACAESQTTSNPSSSTPPDASSISATSTPDDPIPAPATPANDSGEVKSVVATTTEENPILLNNGIKLRWFNNAGFEIILATGEHILVDPWLDSCTYAPFPIDDVKQVDYVLLSHIHGDHAADVGAIQNKFSRFVLMVPDMSIEALMVQQDLDIRNIYRVNDGRKYEFDNFTVECFGSRHTENGSFKSWKLKDNKTPDAYEFLNSDYGTLDVVNYLITAKDGTKVIVWAGMTTEDQKHALAGTNADIAIMHVSPKQNMDIFGEMVAAWAPKVVIPHHYDIWDSFTHDFMASTLRPEQIQKYLKDPVEGVTNSGFDTAGYMADLAATIHKYASTTDFLMIAHKDWYSFGFGYQLNNQSGS